MVRQGEWQNFSRFFQSGMYRSRTSRLARPPQKSSKPATAVPTSLPESPVSAPNSNSPHARSNPGFFSCKNIFYNLQNFPDLPSASGWSGHMMRGISIMPGWSWSSIRSPALLYFSFDQGYLIYFLHSGCQFVKTVFNSSQPRFAITFHALRAIC